jgi:ATP phosphoribosyltransferase
MNVPNDKIDAVKILPVLRSLTVLPLAQEGWSSVHSVIDKDSFGCNGSAERSWCRRILICPIEKWYYKKNNLILKTKSNTYSVGIWN